jgi:uncharacterized radical SAM superfamily Fe-S cluster-containing enzyme
MSQPVPPEDPVALLPSSVVLKSTTSLCPECLAKVPATVVERDGRVFLEKSWDLHGEDVALLATDASLYWRGSQGAGPGCGPYGCGANGHSCSLIFEITQRCNLTCPTCYAGSSPHHSAALSVKDFTQQLDRLLADGKAGTDVVQLSGGEPTVHPDLERFIEVCFEREVQKVYVNTNGIRLAKDPDLAKRLGALNAGGDRLQLYLQFDGFRHETYDLIRGAAGLLPLKRLAIQNALDAGLFVLPVMTVTRGVNLDEIGEVMRMVLEYHPRMTTLMLQPAFFSGRYENDREDRLTMAEVVHEVARQSDGIFSVDDFGPIPCSDPNCFGIGVGLVKGDGVIPVSRYFPRFDKWTDTDISKTIERVARRLPQHMIEDLAEDELIESLLDLLTGDDESRDWSNYQNLFVVTIKPFMDAHTYDQDRIDACCAHIVNRAGEPVSFCEYNALHRPQGRM